MFPHSARIFRDLALIDHLVDKAVALRFLCGHKVVALAVRINGIKRFGFIMKVIIFHTMILSIFLVKHQIEIYLIQYQVNI